MVALKVNGNSFMTEVPFIWKPAHLFAMDWFLYDTDFRHEKNNPDQWSLLMQYSTEFKKTEIKEKAHSKIR